MKNTTVLLMVSITLLFASCTKSDKDNPDNIVTAKFVNHWFTDFNGTIDGGEGYDIIKSSVDGKIYVCGAFLHVNENTDMKNLTRWDPSKNQWEQVPGIDKYHSNFIRCVDEGANGDLFFGGDFSMIGGKTAYKIGQFSPSTGTWSSLRDINFYDDAQQYGPVGGGVYAVVVSGDYVYIGGGTFTTDSVEMRYIRRFNTVSKTWGPVGGGVNDVIKAMEVDDAGNIYVGGRFTQVGGSIPANYVAKWNGTSWEALGEGVDDYVLTLKYGNDKLYVGGSFKYVGSGIQSRRIASWNGAGWEAMDMGIAATWGDTPTVQDITIDSDGKVYIGGFFDKNYRTDDVLNHVAVYDNGQWLPLGDGLATSSSQGVMGMMADGKDVYFTGYFTQGSGDPNAKINTAIWNDTK